MHTSIRRTAGAAGFVALVLVAGLHAQDRERPGAAKGDDAALAEGLRNVINHGADLYNLNRDALGCYRVYQGALLAVRPLLAQHPELQKTIDEGLASADRLPVAAERAFALRKVLDDVRLRVKGGEAVASDKKGPKAGGPGEKAVPKKPAGVPLTLWARLGGEDVVRLVVDEFVRTAGADPKVNFTRGGKVKLTDRDVEELKNKLVQLISQATGGPLKYTGADMRKSHKGMNITDAEFDAAAAHLRKALERHGARAADVQDLLEIVEDTRDEIVEGKGKDGDKAPAPAPAKDKKAPAKGGKDQAPGGKVSGRVRFQGKPVTSGTVLFAEEGGKQTFSAPLGPDGAYAFPTPVPYGTYRVAIGTAKGGQTVVPPTYRDPATSALRLEVRQPAQQHDIELR